MSKVVSGDDTGFVSGVVLGPQASTRRELAVPYRWDGLSAADAGVLARFMGALGVAPAELHTHVPVGCARDVAGEGAGEWCVRMASALYPRRVDAALRFGETWWLCECKPDSRPGGLGQCLCYWYWWHRDCPALACSRVLLLASSVQVDEAAVYAACGVEVVQV
jgi:hypothetical protein